MRNIKSILCSSLVLAGCYMQDADVQLQEQEQALVEPGMIGAEVTRDGKYCAGWKSSNNHPQEAVIAATLDCERQHGFTPYPGEATLTVRHPPNMGTLDFLRHGEAVAQLAEDAAASADYTRTQSAVMHERTLMELDSVLRGFADSQKRQIDRPDPRITQPLENFRNSVNASFGAAYGAGRVVLAEKRRKAEALREILRVTRARLAPVADDYTSLVAAFRSYRATEASVIAKLTELSNRASAATLQQLPQVQVDVVAYIRAANAGGNDILLRSSRLQASMARRDQEYANAISEYADFMAEYPEVAPKNFTADSQRSVSNMIAYVEQRRVQTDAQGTRLLDGIAARKRGLMLAAADAETRQTRLNAAHMRASAGFLKEVTAWTTAMDAPQEKTTKYLFSLWTEKYDRYLAYVALEPLCSASNDAWRGTGCIALNRGIARARAAVSTGIPTQIRLSISPLRRAGVPAEVLAAIQADLTAGRIRDAVVRYDVAARMTEEM